MEDFKFPEVVYVESGTRRPLEEKWLRYFNEFDPKPLGNALLELRWSFLAGALAMNSIPQDAATLRALRKEFMSYIDEMRAYAQKEPAA